jgi:hypothetical protein
MLGAAALYCGCSPDESKAVSKPDSTSTESAQSHTPGENVQLSAVAFNQPFQVMANGRAITVDTGHAAPAYADMDGDKIPDLIVGQFDGGKARIYKNHGTATNQEFKDFEWFQAGGKTATVDYG